METGEAANEKVSARLERLLGVGQPTWYTAVERGYTQARRLRAHFSSGLSVFVKLATDAVTAEWLRAEYRIYSQVTRGYLPRLLGWDDDGESPLLVLEDLSAADWPPPWHPSQVDQVLKTLAEIRETPAPPGIPPLDRSDLAGWSLLAEDPTPFLALGLCSAGWLQEALPALVEAERHAPLAGSDLLHLDMRSDNICFAGNRTLVVDWNMACLGNGPLDVAAWLPSLQAEGGPEPEQILPHAPELAAVVSGFVAARAGLPRIEKAPRVREVQLQQLRTALPWVVRALRLPASF